MERSRNSYKIIKEEITIEHLFSTEYEYTIDNEKVLLYAIIYENNDIYILSPIHYVNFESAIDKKQTKIIEKNDIVTLQCDNIHQIKPTFSWFSNDL